MSDVWRIVHLDQTFATPIENTFNSIKAELKKGIRKERQQKLLIDRWEECEEFAKKIVELSQSSDDPTAALTPAYEDDGGIIPGYYILRHKKWSAYYRIDHAQRLCTGVLARYESEGSIQTLQSILKNL